MVNHSDSTQWVRHNKFMEKIFAATMIEQGSLNGTEQKYKSMQLDNILDLYENVKNWNREETAKKNTKSILNVATEKRCYFKCEVCGYERVAQEDRHCPMCGEKFNITE